MRLELNGWDLGITFSACHFIPGHEKCSRLHGHNYVLNMKVEGTQNEYGMIMDFLSLKDTLRNVAEELDHRMLLPGGSKHININLDRQKGKVHADFQGKEYVFPLEDVAILDISIISAEELSRFVLERVLQVLAVPDNVTEICVGVDEGKGQGAWTCRKL